MSNGLEGSPGRWWEIRSDGQGEGGYRELMTDNRGRSRPERSLSAGADLADEPGHPARVFLWPIVSVVAAVGLILSVVYVVSQNSKVSTDKFTRPESAMPAPPAAPGRAPGTAEPKIDRDAGSGGEATPGRRGTPVLPSVPSGPSSASDPDSPTIRSRPDTPAGPPALPSASAGTPGPTSTSSAPVDRLRDGSGDAGGNTGNQSAAAPTPSATAPPQKPPVVLEDEGHAPAAPRSEAVGKLVLGTGGCARSINKYYACTITPRGAFYYLPGTTNPSGHMDTGEPRWFLCQSDGSKYSVASRVNHWWAWLWVPYAELGVWVPVVFLKGVPSDDKPVPGLPLCDGASEPTTESTKKPATESTGRAPANRAPATSTEPPN